MENIENTENLEKEILEIYLRIQKKLDELKTDGNSLDISKIKKRCGCLYEQITKTCHLIKKTKIDCFNWFEIYIKILEKEKDAYLSKIYIQKNIKNEKKNSGYYTKNSKDYVIAQNKKRIYKIISKAVDYVNKSMDYDYDSSYCILDCIDIFIEDAKSLEHFPYKEGKTELYMIFMENPCEELIEEIKNKNIIPLTINELNNIQEVKNSDIINLDMNVIIALCSDINFLEPESELITKILKNKIFIGVNGVIIDDYGKITNEIFCKYIKDESEILVEEMKKYKKVIICKSAYDSIKKILEHSGSETEKSKLDDVIKKFNIEIIDESNLRCDIFEDENLIKNEMKIYNKVERDVMKTGYMMDALNLTSNYRYVEFLLSKNIFIDAKITASLNLICQINKKFGKI
jgi:hypothetical protein